MDASDQVINFRAVAAEAKVSTAWLYGQRELRARIMRSRGRTDHCQVPATSAALSRERMSQQEHRGNLATSHQSALGEE
jgi:hypothetical protein